MQKSVFIDYVRGLSILTIVIYHLTLDAALPPIWRAIFAFGGAGVHVFFFSSGYGLAKSRYTTYFDFAKRRLNKVLLPYYITVTLIFVLNIFLKIYPSGLSAYLSHIFLYKMFVPEYDISFGGHFWFISTIIQFYLVFPILLRFLKSDKLYLFFASALFISLAYSTIVNFTPYAGERILNGFFIQYLWEFTLGMVIAKSDKLGKMIDQPIIYYFIIAIFCVPLTAFLAIKGGVVGRNLNDIFSFSAYTAISIILYRLAGPLKKFVLWVTSFSYGLYLIHVFILNCFYNAYIISIFGFFTLPVIFVGIILFSYVYNIFLAKVSTVNRIWSTN